MIVRLLKKLVSRSSLLVISGLILGVVLLLGSHEASKMTSTDDFCYEACHVHPHSTISWKLSTHYKNKSGIVIRCVDCHLPPEGIYYYTEKARTGSRDLYGKLFKDISKIDWDAKSALEYAKTYTYDESCMHCHQDLYSLNLSKKGIQAHENYLKNRDKGIFCINCHLHVGHYTDKPLLPTDLEASSADGTPATATTFAAPRPRKLPPPPPPGPIPGEKFENYTDIIPGANIRFEMVAIQPGTFQMGSPRDEPYRRPNEGPVHKVTLTPYWMGKAEVTWAEFEEFYSQTATRGKNEKGIALQNEDAADAITGPTPPYGSPDQGWGKADRPAITMTYHAAAKYCEWLTRVTGKRYRLPTEAEWEYACRAGTKTPYFFPGDPNDFTKRYWLNRIFGVDTQPLADYAKYGMNSGRKSYPPTAVKPNPWGLVNMLGNVKEFCLDWYEATAYSQYSGEEAVDPRGPDEGTEHVIRGGSFKSDAVDLRSAARDFTRTDAWLATDPQSPKSIWWYSDSNDVGFRIVREFEGELPPPQ